MTFRLLCYMVLLLAGVGNVAGQGAIDGFLKGKGNTDIALTYSHEHYDIYYFGQEEQELSTTIQSLNFFATGGINEAADWVLALPYLWLDSLNRSVQDAIVAIKYRNRRLETAQGSWDVITSVGFSFPVGNYPSGPLGLRAIVFQPRLLTQYKDDNGFFFNIQSGLDFRVTPSSQFGIPVISRLGYAGTHIYFDAWVDFFGTIEPGVDTQIGAGEGAVWWKVGGTVYAPIGQHIGVFAGFAQYLSGRNIGKATRFNIGAVGKL
ncbi:MAG: hypothetical protein KDC44_03105 [Phaeodactylibacter sp.]|nr:hypothetical protein [Phaeodactylibacter sp.]